MLNAVNMRVEYVQRRGGQRHGRRMRVEKSGPSTPPASQQHVCEEYFESSLIDTLEIAEKGETSDPKGEDKKTEEPGEKESDMNALIRQLLTTLEKQQEKPGNSSKGKYYHFLAPSPPSGCETNRVHYSQAKVASSWDSRAQSKSPASGLRDSREWQAVQRPHK